MGTHDHRNCLWCHECWTMIVTSPPLAKAENLPGKLHALYEAFADSDRPAVRGDA